MKIYQDDFLCIHCDKQITAQSFMGTSHRNHCPYCLWSKHVDSKKPGDRESACQAAMEPIGLTCKHERENKYSKQKQGELMIVHRCLQCGKININRIAGDDSENELLTLLQKKSLSIETVNTLQHNAIDMLGSESEQEVRKQLFGVTKN